VALSALLLAGAPAASQDKDKEAAPLAAGKDVPGPFHAYNVTGVNVYEEAPKGTEKEGEKRLRYNSKGRYHCLVTHYDIDPVVMLFAQNLDGGEAFEAFLKKLDDKVGRNERVRLRAFVVFRYADVPDVLKSDNKRDAKAKALATLADKLGLKHVTFVLAGEPEVRKYGLDPGNALTAVLYRRLRIEALHALPPAQVTEEKLQAILADVAGKLGAAR
jgi:hypothetical protein